MINIMYVCLIRGDKARYEEEYKANGEGCFIYEVQHPGIGEWVCLDATRAFGTMGRLINHGDKTENLKAMVAVVDKVLRLGFLASRDITVGEELLYDYGSQTQAPHWLMRRPPYSQAKVLYKNEYRIVIFN